MLRFKHEKDVLRFHFLHPWALTVAYAMVNFLDQKEKNLLITSTVSTLAEDNALKRISNTHRTRRAFDVSIYGWEEEFTAFFIHTFNQNFASVAAYSDILKKPLLVKRHNNGNGDHLHVQVHSKFSLPILEEFEFRTLALDGDQ